MVEGYFDVLALAEAGVEPRRGLARDGAHRSISSTCLRRFTRDIVVCFDGDAAGARAAEKSLATFLEAGLWGHGAFLPPGDDPDTFVQREGQAAALALLAGGDAAPRLLPRPRGPAREHGRRARRRRAAGRDVAPQDRRSVRVRHDGAARRRAPARARGVAAAKRRRAPAHDGATRRRGDGAREPSRSRALDVGARRRRKPRVPRSCS